MINLSLAEGPYQTFKNIKSRIEGISFSDDMKLLDLKNRFRELDGYFSTAGDFQVLFQDDFLLACLGLTKGRDRKGEITATHADAFFIDTFYGKEVPAGFGKYLNMSNAAELDHSSRQTVSKRFKTGAPAQSGAFVETMATDWERANTT